jgi:hypothetical protein
MIDSEGSTSSATPSAWRIAPPALAASFGLWPAASSADCSD